MPFGISELLDKFSDYLRWDFAVAVVGAAILLAGKQIWRAVFRLIEMRHEYDLTGYWAGKCVLPHFRGVPTLELWHYSRTLGGVELFFYSYKKPSPELKPVKWVGGGVLRGNRLSAYYYMKNPNSSETGTITMELKGPMLTGCYAQYDPMARSKYPFKKNYAQVRVTLTWRQRARSIFRPPVDTYQEVENLLEQEKRKRGLIAH